MNVLSKYCLILLGLVMAAALVLIFDAFLKTEYAKGHPEEIEAYLEKQKRMTKGTTIPLPATPDWRQDFSIMKSVWWLDLASISLLMGILMTWCFYFHLVRAV